MTPLGYPYRLPLHRLLQEDAVASLSVREAAKLLGVAPSTVQRHRQRMPLQPDDDGMVHVPLTYGADGRWRPGRRIPNPGRTLRVLQLRQQGASIRVIACTLRCSPSTVHRTLARIPEEERTSIIDVLSRVLARAFAGPVH